MNIEIHYSGSKGNLYAVDDGRTSLLIDPGVPIKAVKRALDYRLSKIDGCLVSHCHADHSRSAGDIMRAGIDCYMTRGTKETLQLNGHRVQTIQAGKLFNIGTFGCLPFKAIHDSPEPVGFLLVSGREKLLFSTDTQYISPRFRGLTHIMIEANYNPDILRKNVEKGLIDITLAKYIIQNHMSIETAKDFFTVNDMRYVKEIHLLHLSEGNSNAEKFKAEIQRIAGRPVYI